MQVYDQYGQPVEPLDPTAPHPAATPDAPMPPPGGYGLLAQYQARGLLPFSTPTMGGFPICANCAGQLGAAPRVPTQISLTTMALVIAGAWWLLKED